MRDEVVAAVALVSLSLLCGGCVERKMLIRSEPSGAPAWVDEQRVGTTPVDVPFSHYGRRRVRVGPKRDATGRVEFVAAERVVEVKAPWYEQFPIDFVSEVLWPGRLVDEHEVKLVLPPASDQAHLYGEERAEDVRDQALEFRKKALTPVPELEQ